MSELWSNAGLTTVNALFRQSCEERPDRIFLDFSGETFTYRQFDHEVARLATGLKAMGVERGDRICSVLENGPDAVFVWFAVNRLGAIHVPINTDYKGEFLRHQINDAGARIVVDAAACETDGAIAVGEHDVGCDARRECR